MNTVPSVYTLMNKIYLTVHREHRIAEGTVFRNQT